MFKVHLGDTPHNLTEKDFQDLGAMTDGFSGSDVSVVVKDVLMQPIRLLREATHYRKVRARLGVSGAMGVVVRGLRGVHTGLDRLPRSAESTQDPDPRIHPSQPPSVQVRHPDGGDAYEPCAPGAPGAQEVTLQYFADKGLADRVLPPTITRADFDKVRWLVRLGAGWLEG